ncbi:Dabb family protein [Sphingobacterium sp. SYP-B4668]|uniref:Dabb family protein n=1 Tax=Sphingobacterium sp. SYP-B4668 TaxID=2996035 RepID=UPI0022DD5311|nr:Dabb family protein [Sphingobacterium sp. SYP-B4668]
MKRRTFIQSTASLIGTTALTTTVSADSNNVVKSQIVHSVYFWLKEGSTEKEITAFAAFFEALKTIPDVVSLKYGRPAPTNPRPVVDQTWTYNLIVVFDHMDHINTYENHPIHLKAIKDYSSNWTKVVVYDTLLD